MTPTVYATAFTSASKWDQLKDGVKAISTEDICWLRCDIKLISPLPNALSSEKARECDAVETAFIRNSVVAEASHSSFLAVRNGVFYTYPDSNLIIPGITKKVVFEICKNRNIQVIEEGIPSSELDVMDEMMIAGTESEVTPVLQIDKNLVGNGKPGPVTILIR